MSVTFAVLALVGWQIIESTRRHDDGRIIWALWGWVGLLILVPSLMAAIILGMAEVRAE
jgi:hypothetical protein